MVLFGAMFFSCAKKVVEKPDNLIPKEKMVLILHDLALFNAAKTSYSNSLENYDIEVMEFLYQKYKIDSAQFSQSDLYYASLPLEYQSIYTEVEAQFDDRIKALEADDEKQKDSIANAQQKRRDRIEKLKGDSIPNPVP